MPDYKSQRTIYQLAEGAKGLKLENARLLDALRAVAEAWEDRLTCLDCLPEDSGYILAKEKSMFYGRLCEDHNVRIQAACAAAAEVRKGDEDGE